MNKEDTLQIFGNHPKSNHEGQLPDGRETKGLDSPQIANQIFPPDLDGASVLDIGCSEGLFCFEAKRRNAGRVVAIDIDKERLTEAIRLSRALSTDIEFLECDINNVGELGTFDYVLCLNSLHLVEDRVDFIHKLIRVARRKLILEISDLRHRTSIKRHMLLSPLLTLLPDRFHPSVLILDSYSRHLMTRKWIEGIFRNQYSNVERVEFPDSGRVNRNLVVATMRRLDGLQVISGPSAVGKSVFIDRLGSEDPEVVDILGFTLKDGWQVVMAKDLKTSAGRQIDRLLLH